MLRLQSRAVGCGRGLDVYNLPSSSAAVTKPHSCRRTRTFPPCAHHTTWLKVSVKWVQRGWKGRESGKNEHGSWPGEQFYIKKRPKYSNERGERSLLNNMEHFTRIFWCFCSQLVFVLSLHLWPQWWFTANNSFPSLAQLYWIWR